MTVSTTETFIPYDQMKQYMLVDFVELKKTEDSMFSDVMIVEYQGKDYELFWDEHYSYYTGKVGNVEGFIP